MVTVLARWLFAAGCTTEDTIEEANHVVEAGGGARVCALPPQASSPHFPSSGGEVWVHACREGGALLLAPPVHLRHHPKPT